MYDRWDKDGRYKKIALALVGQCEDEKLTVEEARFVLEIAMGKVSCQGNYVQVKSAPDLPAYCTDSHTP